jgi:hypothetical protein
MYMPYPHPTTSTQKQQYTIVSSNKRISMRAQY